MSGVRTLAVPVVAAFTLAGALAGAGGASAAETLRSTMTGKQEIPKGDLNGRGTARITTNRARGRVCFRIRLSRVGSVSAGHIHQEVRGKVGDVVVPFFDKPTRRPQGCTRGVKKSLIRAIERRPNRFYVNVHNKRHPGGAVRGQLRR